MSLTDQVIKPARRCNQNIHASPELVHLRLLTHAAKDDARAQRKVFAIPLKVFVDLQGQFTRRRQDQRADKTLLRFSLFKKTLQNRQRKSRRLAGTGLRTAQHIPSFEHRRNGLALDRRGLGIAAALDGGKQLGI